MSHKQNNDRRRGGGQTDHFTKMHRRTMETPAWRALSPKAQALYVWILLEWRGAKNNNNGKIRLSARQAAEKMGIVNTTTASQAFHELQAKGFLVVTELAVLGIGGYAKGTRFEITEFPLPGALPYVGRRLFAKWQKGSDFDILKAAVHNRSGQNGKINISS